MKLKIIFILLLITCLVYPVSAAVDLVWDNTTQPDDINVVDTNYDATLIFAGTSGGNITAYNQSGCITWFLRTNTTDPGDRNITKIISTQDGALVWMGNSHTAGYISSSGNMIFNKTIPPTQNISDIAVSNDGGYWAMTVGTPARIFVYTAAGSLVAENTTIGGVVNWSHVGFNINEGWLVTANKSNNTLYFWNFTPWSGWVQYNPNKTGSKNTSQAFIDKFPYKMYLNISMPAGYDVTLTFNTSNSNTSTTTPIVKLNNSYYEYRPTYTGNRFFWTPINYLPNASNTTYFMDNQSLVLNASYVSGGLYTVKLRNVTDIIGTNGGNFTLYFGCTTYTYSNVGGAPIADGTSIITNFTANNVWMRPSSSVTSIAYIIIGGGGGGGSGGNPTGTSGFGGSAGGYSSSTLSLFSAQRYVSVYVGGGGAGGAAIAGTAGSPTSINGTPTDPISRNVSGGAGGGINNPSPTVGINGGSGSLNLSTYYGENGSVGTGWDGIQCAINGQPAGIAGLGYGAGGGAGGLGTGGCLPPGGDGATGIVKLTYNYYKTVPTSGTLSVKYSADTGYGLNQSSVRFYVGDIMDLDQSWDGGYIVLSTDEGADGNGALYRQPVYATGIPIIGSTRSFYGTTEAPFTGTPHDVKASNGASFNFEARGPDAYMYDYTGAAKVQVLTVGTMNSVDLDVVSALIGAYGGTEGRLGIISRIGSPTFYTYYTGSVGNNINSVAVSWDGAFVTVGRDSGIVETYATNITENVTANVTPSIVEAYVKVYKDGNVYPYQVVAVFSGTSSTGPWTSVANLTTDTTGHVSYVTTAGTYYKFVVNPVGGSDVGGEGSAVWLSNTGSTTVNIYILSPSTPYEWNAYYDITNHNVTVLYSDTVEPISVTITINDLKTGLPVLARTYLATSNFTLSYHDQLENGTYQVILVANRLGTVVRDQRIVSAPNLYNITLPVDKYILYAISTLFLMLIAGMFTYINSKRGALAVVVLAAVFMWFGFLPSGNLMLAIAMLAAIFAVMSLFGSRV